MSWHGICPWENHSKAWVLPVRESGFQRRSLTLNLWSLDKKITARSCSETVCTVMSAVMKITCAWSCRALFVISRILNLILYLSESNSKAIVCRCGQSEKHYIWVNKQHFGFADVYSAWAIIRWKKIIGYPP